MTFLTWPKELNCLVNIIDEGKKMKIEEVFQTKMAISTAKYRHIMVEDNRDHIPFAKL